MNYRHNIKKNITYEYISNCTYDKHNDSVCPVFSIDYILKEAEPDPKEQNEMLLKVTIYTKSDV